MRMQEDANGPPTYSLSSPDDLSNSGEVSGGSGIHARDELTRTAVHIKIAPAVSTACSIILSFGVVGCAAELIYLCFLKPDAANIVVPLLIWSALRFSRRTK